MYANLNQGQQNPLQTFGQFVGIQNAMAENQLRQNQNAQFQQMFTARNAMGELSQHAVDPTTGQMDYDKFAKLISIDPRTAWMAPEMLNQLAQRQGVQLDNVKKDLEIAKTRFTNLSDGITPLIELGNNVTQADVMNSLSRAWGQGLIDKDTALRTIANLPKDGAPLADFVRRQSLWAQGHKDAAESVLGKLQTTNTGGQTQFQFMSPYGPGGQPTVRPVGTLQNTPTPGEANALVDTVLPKDIPELGLKAGSKISIPRPAAAPLTTPLTSSFQPAPGVNLQSPISGGQSGAETAQVIPQGAQDQILDRANAGVPKSSVPSGAVTALSPGEVATQNDQAKQNVDFSTQLAKNAQSAPENIRPLQQQLALLKQFRAGGWGPEIRNGIAQLVQSIPGLDDKTRQTWADAIVGSPTDHPNAPAAKAIQEFQKYATVTAMKTLVAAGGNDFRPAVFEFSKFFDNLPTAASDPRASESMLNFLVKQYQYQILENTAYQNMVQHIKNGTAPKSMPQSLQDLTPGAWTNIWNRIKEKQGYYNPYPEVITNAMKKAQ